MNNVTIRGWRVWLPLFVWAAAIVFLPAWPFPTEFSAFDNRRIVVVFLLCAGGFFYLFSPHASQDQPVFSWFAKFLIYVFFVIGLVSASGAPVADYAFAEWSLFLLVVVSVLILQEADLVELRGVLLWGVSLSAFVYTFSVLVNVYSAHLRAESMPLDAYRINNFINLRYLNQWLSWLIPLLPAALYLSVPRCRNAIWRVAIVMLLAMLWALLIHSGGRGTLFSLLGSSVLLMMVFGWSVRVWLGWQVVGAAVGSVLAVLIFGASWPWQAGVGQQAGVWSLGDAGRIPLWAASLTLIADHPWLGIGPMQFASLQFGIAAHPHNFPLQVAVEWGLPAAILLLSLIGWAGFRWLAGVRRWNVAGRLASSERILVIALTGSLLTAGAHSLVSGVVVTPMSQVMLVIVVALALKFYGTRAHDGDGMPAASPKWGGLGARAVVVIVALWLAAFTWTGVKSHQYNWDVGGKAAWGNYQPRFWHQGKLVHHLDAPWLSFSREGRLLPGDGNVGR